MFLSEKTCKTLNGSGIFLVLEFNFNMKVKKGDTIKVSYTGTFDNGEVFDATSMHNGELLEFTVGQGQVVPGFDNAMLDKELKKEFSVRIEPKDAYGEYDEKAMQKLKRSELPADLTPEIGMVLQLQHQHGDHVHNILATIKEITDDEITIDINHPMAGKTLNFKITVEEIVE